MYAIRSYYDILNGIIRQGRLEKSIKILPEPIKEMKRAFAFAPDKELLYHFLSPYISACVTSDDYRSIYQKWFSPPSSWWTIKRVVVLAILLIVLVLGSISVLYQRSLLAFNRQLRQSIEEKDAAGRKLLESFKQIQGMNSLLEEAKERAEESDRLKSASYNFV